MQTARPIRLLLLLAFLALAGLARAEWTVVSSEKQSSPNEKVEHWTTAVEDPASGARATFHLAVFDSRAATLRVVDQPAAPRRDLAETMEETKALAGVNGGYFDPDDAPLGLSVSEGRTISPLRKAKLLTGVLTATATRVDIVRTSRFAMSSKIKSARQCGPLLVERSAPIRGLNATRPARRTFAAVDGSGRTALGVSSALSLAQLGQVLAQTSPAGKMKIVRALNLDGGSSSAFWFAGSKDAFSLRELKTVRDFIAIVPSATR